jgi:hypothetical protein
MSPRFDQIPFSPGNFVQGKLFLVNSFVLEAVQSRLQKLRTISHERIVVRDAPLSGFHNNQAPMAHIPMNCEITSKKVAYEI